MENIIFHQRFSYAAISLVKNYNVVPLKISNILEPNTWEANEMIEISGSYKKPSAHFFYTKNEGSMESAAFPKAISKHVTTKDRQIKRHYNNPFAEINVHIIERKIKKVGDKISITCSDYKKRRDYNSKFFRSYIERNTLSFDLSNGNFKIIRVIIQGKKRTQSFVTNSFTSLYGLLLTVPGIFNVERYYEKKYNKTIQKELGDELDDNAFYDIMCDLFNFKEKRQPSSSLYNQFYKHLVVKFVELKKIKIPDGEYEHLLKCYYPTEKFFKKNDRKLIASVLDYLGCKSKILIKIVHDYRNLDLLALTNFTSLFGKDYTKYIGNIRNEFFDFSNKEIPPKENFFRIKSRIKEFNDATSLLNFYDDEKENIIRCVNSITTLNKTLSQELCKDIFDHIYMVNKIREVDSSFRIRANSAEEFNKEHQQFSKIISAMKKGWVIEYVFNEKMVSEIETPITKFRSYDIGGGLKGTDMNSKITLYPHILKREEEYIEEGEFMHHCVASYADHEKSIIISLRNVDGTNRVTSEFNIQDGRCVQSRHFCNGPVPSEFTAALEDLKDKVIIHAKWGILNWTEKKKVRLKINGIEITPEIVSPNPLHNLPF